MPAGDGNEPRRTGAARSAAETGDRPERSECDRHGRETRDGRASPPPARTATESSTPPAQTHAGAA